MDTTMRRFPVLLTALLLVGGLFWPLVPSAQAAVPPQFADDLVAGLRSPTALAFMPDGRMLATTQPGQLRVISGGVLRPAPALDLNTRMCTDSERGPLGVAADPDPGSTAIFLFYPPRGSSAACPTNAASGAEPARHSPEPGIPGRPAGTPLRAAGTARGLKPRAGC
jgi:hypothetical protein